MKTPVAPSLLASGRDRRFSTAGLSRTRIADSRERSADRAADRALAKVGQKADVETLAESLGADLRDIRIHADSDADRLTRNWGAEALTIGSDIFFRRGRYAPERPRGVHLLAHELAHAADGGLVAGRWSSLGSYSWDHHIVHDHRVVVHVRVGSVDDWKERLKNLDDSDELWAVKGFLETASDPSMVGRNRPLNPARGRNYTNNIQRAPSAAEIKNFVVALYTVGSEIDLPSHSFEETGIPRRAFQADVSEILQKHGGLAIQEQAARGESISSSAITSLGEQGGRQIRMSVLMNAGATAMKAVDLIATARRSNDVDSLSDANATIRNAGRVIRYTLEAHDAAVAFNQSVLTTVFDLAWGTIPGGGALAGTAKSLLALGFKHMLTEAAKDTEPKKQAQAILNQFVKFVRQARRDGHFGSGNQSVNIENDAITGFEAAMR